MIRVDLRLDFLLLPFAFSSLLAQESTVGGIVGEVQDSSGAAIAGASVIVTNAATGTHRTTETDVSGAFSVPNLPPATYQLRVERTGFQAAVVESLELRVGL